MSDLTLVLLSFAVNGLSGFFVVLLTSLTSQPEDAILMVILYLLITMPVALLVLTTLFVEDTNNGEG